MGCGCFWRSKHEMGLFAVLFGMIAIMSLFVPSINLFSAANRFLGHSMSDLSWSGSATGCLVTLMILLCWTFVGHRFSRTEKMDLIVKLVVLLLLCSGMKIYMKKLVHTPRPYTVAMTQAGDISKPMAFYQLNSIQRDQVWQEMSGKVSYWRVRNWKAETTYSFPSGHTVFVTLCLLFFGGIWLKQKRLISVAVLVAWGGSVVYSRLWLGMHRPADLFGAMIAVGVIYACVSGWYPYILPVLRSLQTKLRLV